MGLNSVPSTPFELLNVDCKLKPWEWVVRALFSHAVSINVTAWHFCNSLDSSTTNTPMKRLFAERWARPFPLGLCRPWHRSFGNQPPCYLSRDGLLPIWWRSFPKEEAHVIGVCSFLLTIIHDYTCILRLVSAIEYRLTFSAYSQSLVHQSSGWRSPLGMPNCSESRSFQGNPRASRLLVGRSHRLEAS